MLALQVLFTLNSNLTLVCFFLPTLALIYAVPFAVTTPFLLTVATDFFCGGPFYFLFCAFYLLTGIFALGQGKLCFVQFDLRGTYRCGIHCQTHYYK